MDVNTPDMQNVEVSPFEWIILDLHTKDIIFLTKL